MAGEVAAPPETYAGRGFRAAEPLPCCAGGEGRLPDVRVETAQKDAQALKQQAQKDAEQARRDALNSAKDDVANLSIEIASKLIQKELKADDQKELIDSYIEGLVEHES